MKEKVLIIGSKGMLGQELVKTLEKDGKYIVTAWDQEDIDVTDFKKFNQKVRELSPEIIFNAAAYNAVDLCEEDPKEYEKAQILNSETPGNLAKIAKEIGAVLIHYSSDYVFSGMPEIVEPSGCTGMCASCTLHQGLESQIGFREDDQPDPVQKYGQTKLEGEKNVQKFGEKFYIIRLSKLFGQPAQSSKAKKSFFQTMLEIGQKAQKDGTPVRAVDEEASCFTYAPDLAQKSLEILQKQKPFGIYHVTNSDYCTWYEAVLELYKQAGLEKVEVIPVSGIEFSRSAARPYISILINTKLEPLRSFKEALKDFLNEIEK